MLTAVASREGDGTHNHVAAATKEKHSPPYAFALLDTCTLCTLTAQSIKSLRIHAKNCRGKFFTHCQSLIFQREKLDLTWGMQHIFRKHIQEIGPTRKNICIGRLTAVSTGMVQMFRYKWCHRTPALKANRQCFHVFSFIESVSVEQRWK